MKANHTTSERGDLFDLQGTIQHGTVSRPGYALKVGKTLGRPGVRRTAEDVHLR